MPLKNAIIDFLKKNPGIYTLTDLAYALKRNPTTNMRHALEVLVALGEVQQVPVATDKNRLAWGYTANQPRLKSL